MNNNNDDLISTRTDMYIDPDTGMLCRQMLTLTPIVFFTPQFWDRHQYTMADIRTTFKACRSQHLWLHAQHLGIAMDSSAVKTGFSTDSEMIWGAKQPAVAQLMKHVEKVYKASSGPDMLLTIPSHYPGLPCHIVSQQQFDSYAAGINCQTVFQWKDIQCIATGFELDKSVIAMCRVLPVAEYAAIYRPDRDCLAMQPTLSPFATHARVEETWFVCTSRPTNIKQKATRKKSLSKKKAQKVSTGLS